MKNDKIDQFIRTLSELSTFLVEIKHRSIYGGEETKISEAVERYLDGFCFNNKEVTEQSRVSTVNSSDNLGGEEVIRLKYGQGHIARKTRIRKKR